MIRDVAEWLSFNIGFSVEAWMETMFALPFIVWLVVWTIGHYESRDE